MAVRLSLTENRRIVSANAHFYERPTEPLYLDRTLVFHDFVYLVEGEWTITENETDYHLKKDDVLLLSAGHHHYTRLPCAPGTRTMCIHVTGEQGDLPENDQSVCLPALIHVKGFPAAKEYFEKIVSEFWGEKPRKEARMNWLFRLLILELSDACAGNAKNDPGIAEKIIALVNAAPHRRFTTKEIAERFLVSTKTVDAALIRLTGLSFAKYQNARKLEMAASQLAVEPDVTLAEIAATFAFCDEFHLSRAFRQKYGVPPSKYRSSLMKKDG